MVAMKISPRFGLNVQLNTRSDRDAGQQVKAFALHTGKPVALTEDGDTDTFRLVAGKDDLLTLLRDGKPNEQEPSKFVTLYHPTPADGNVYWVLDNMNGYDPETLGGEIDDARKTGEPYLGMLEFVDKVRKGLGLGADEAQQVLGENPDPAVFTPARVAEIAAGFPQINDRFHAPKKG
jgi:hypothetical protein